MPLIFMIISVGDVDIVVLLKSIQFNEALKNSLITTITASLISVSLAFILSVAILRSNIKYKAMFSVFLTLPMLIPSISHGMGLVILFGSNGVLTNLFNLSSNIYGFWGIVIGSIMYSFPIAFLMISDIFKYEDSSPYEAASILGFSGWHKFKAITLPYLRKPLISVFFATFTLILTDYGVPLIVGGKLNTLPVLMYQEVIGLLDFGKGAVIGSVLLFPAIIAFVLDILNKDKSSSSYVSKEMSIKDNKKRDALANVFVIIIILMLMTPIMAFVVLTFTSRYPSDLSFTLNHVKQTLSMSGTTYLLNSIKIAVAVSFIGTVIAYITGYLTARVKNNLSQGLHLIAITTLAIPGIVLGLSYVITFNKTSLYGTLAILVLVNIIHFFASPYLMIYNTFNKINDNLENVGQTLGISRIRMIKDVFIPQTFGTILEMLAYFFVNSMITISAISFLANTKTKPLSLMISQFEGNMMLEASAFVSVIILVTNLLLKGLIHLIKTRNLEKGVLWWLQKDNLKY